MKKYLFLILAVLFFSGQIAAALHARFYCHPTGTVDLLPPIR